MSWSRNGFVRKSTAPAFIALTDMGMSPWPVMMMMGMWIFAFANCAWKSSPLNPGSYDFIGEYHEATAKGRVIAE